MQETAERGRLALPALGPDELAEVAAGGTRWSASLEGSLVPDLGIVDRVAVVEDGEARAVPARGEALETMDPTRRLGRLEPENGTPLAVYFSSGSRPRRPTRITLLTDFAIRLLSCLAQRLTGPRSSRAFADAFWASLVLGKSFTTLSKASSAGCF